MRTPEEILRYGRVILNHRRDLYKLKYGRVVKVSDETNNHKFDYSDYGIWKHQVKDYIEKHEPDKIVKIDSLFSAFETLFYPEFIGEILGILSASIGLDSLESEENGVSLDNSQTAQTTNETERHNEFEPEPIVENPPKKKNKVFIWIAVLCIIIGVIAIIAIFYYFKIDPNSSAAIATIITTFVGIIGTIYAVLTYHK